MIAKPKFKAGNYIINKDYPNRSMRLWKILMCHDFYYYVEVITHPVSYFITGQTYSFGVSFLDGIYKVVDDDKLADLLAIIL